MPDGNGKGEPDETERRCGVCGDINHRMSTWVARHESFDFDAVCESCLVRFFRTGEWKSGKRDTGSDHTHE